MHTPPTNAPEGTSPTAPRPATPPSTAPRRDRRVAVTDLRSMKKRGEAIVMITAYDYPSARLVDEAVDLILVGDTLGMVVLGYETTVPVTMDEMLHHVKAVARGAKRSLVVADMPFMSYQTSPEEALRNAGRFLKEAGAQAVKLEGGVDMADTVRTITAAGIPVMGHIGLTPQSVHQFGGWKVQGKTAQTAIKLMHDALALERAGAFAVVLELVPAPLAALIGKRLRVPTIGIGAGAGCDGQVQVYHDILGLFEDFVPKHTRRYMHAGDAIRSAIGEYASDVREGRFPTDEQSFCMDEHALAELLTTDDTRAANGNGKQHASHPTIPALP